MQITIQAAHNELTPAAREFIEKKFLGLDKLVSNPSALLACEIEQSAAVERDGGKYRAEGNLSIDGQLFRAEATAGTLEGAVDRVRDDLVREFNRARGKKKGLVRRGGAALKRFLHFGR